MAISDPPAGQIVRGDLNCDTIPFQNSDTKTTKLTRYCSKHAHSIIEGNTKGGTRKNFRYRPFKFD